jgi:hypothetical protein
LRCWYLVSWRLCLLGVCLAFLFHVAERERERERERARGTISMVLWWCSEFINLVVTFVRPNFQRKCMWTVHVNCVLDT